MSVSELLKDLRQDFPFYERRAPNGRPFVYLDSAATSLKPQCVIDGISRTLSYHTSNVHRSVHQIGDEATEIYEGARNTVAQFIGASAHEIIFLRNATEALNLIARCWKRKGRTVTSLIEHHSNLLPWPGDATRLPPRPDGTLDTDALGRELARGDVALVSLSHCSNVTGAMIDAATVAKAVHDAGAAFALDGAQSIPHQEIDVREMDCDFLAFSGHKMCGPTGIGVLYGKAGLLAELDWYLKGGATVEQVHVDSAMPKPPPWKFEAGTPPIEAAGGLAVAMEYLAAAGMRTIAAHQHALVQYTLRRIRECVPQSEFLGPTDEQRTGPVSIHIPGLSPHTIARGLSDGYGICVRSGYHCCQPLHEYLSLPPTLRAAPYLYNTKEDIDQFAVALAEIVSLHDDATL